MNINTPVLIFLGLTTLFFSACSCSIPPRPGNLCAVFREKPEWYESARSSQDKWGVPVPVMMAIMYKESGFRAHARPPRKSCFFIFPGPRPSTAYGYAQAIDSTWNIYRKHTGKLGAERENFDDAIDFIGWYCHVSHVKCGMSKDDTYSLYLAYHEGQNGYNSGSYRGKKWLENKARSAGTQSAEYMRQLDSCLNEFEKPKGRGCLYPF